MLCSYWNTQGQRPVTTSGFSKWHVQRKPQHGYDKQLSPRAVVAFFTMSPGDKSSRCSSDERYKNLRAPHGHGSTIKKHKQDQALGPSRKRQLASDFWGTGSRLSQMRWAQKRLRASCVEFHTFPLSSVMKRTFPVSTYTMRCLQSQIQNRPHYGDTREQRPAPTQREAHAEVYSTENEESRHSYTRVSSLIGLIFVSRIMF